MVDVETGPTSDAGGGEYAILRLWKLYRDYIENENLLLAHRATWLLTTQSFLMTAFAFALTRQNGAILENFVTGCGYVWLILTFPAVGVSTALFGALAIQAARSAVNSLRDKWKDILVKHKEVPLLKELPDISGGVGLYPRIMAHVSIQAIPVIFGFGWMWIAWHLYAPLAAQHCSIWKLA